MKLNEYFSSHSGSGVLATADAAGKVDVAIYARPHVLDERTVAFIMHDRLSHHNLQSNPHAAYSFLEDDGDYQGRRLYLTRLHEETDRKKIEALRRPSRRNRRVDGKQFLVTFRVDKILPAVGVDWT